MAHDIIVKQHGVRIDVNTESDAVSEFIASRQWICWQLELRMTAIGPKRTSPGLPKLRGAENAPEIGLRRGFLRTAEPEGDAEHRVVHVQPGVRRDGIYGSVGEEGVRL